MVSLRAHLLRHKIVGELVYPILCCHCNSSFTNIYNLVRHSEKFHAVSNDVMEGTSALQSDRNMDWAGDDSDCQVNNVADSVNISEDIRAEGVALVARMRANSSIPYSIIPAMVE